MLAAGGRARCGVGLMVAAALAGLAVGVAAGNQPGQAEQTREAAKAAAAEQAGLVPLELELPKPAFRGTPRHVPPGSVNLEEPRKGPRPPLMVPPGTRNVARDKPVTSSDKEPIIGALKFVTDGQKAAEEGTYVELGPGVQWVQIDLKEAYTLHAVLVWHYHLNARVYHDVIVQVADDADFITNVRTLFNNDHDNSAGLGIGRDKEYWDTYEGKLIDARGEQARYVRLYSNGSTTDDQNHYVEVEVFARPAK